MYPTVAHMKAPLSEAKLADGHTFALSYFITMPSDVNVFEYISYPLTYSLPLESFRTSPSRSS